MKWNIRKKITALLCIMALLICSTVPALAEYTATFSDVPATHWAYAYVERAAESGLVQGYGNGQYGVGDSVKSSEWSKMLVGLLYPNDVENAIASGMSAEPWWNPYVQIASIRGMLDDTTAYDNYRDGGSTGWNESMVTGSISRYDMAQTIYNIAVRLEWESGDTASIAASVADWSDVPERYQEAVKYCYASGFILGIDDIGTFDGASGMTRGQAATVLCRLLDAVEGTHDFGADTPNNGSAPGSVADRLTVAPATSWYTTGYKYEVTVTGDAISGKLANGATITEENILAMLAELEVIFPEDTSWGAKGSGNDTYYYGSGNPISNGGGCNGFAGMVCDLLYGHGATYTTHNELSKVKCGDIICLYNESTGDEHWIVVTGTSYDSEGLMKFSACEGNSNGRLVWASSRYLSGTEYLYPNSTVYSFFNE